MTAREMFERRGYRFIDLDGELLYEQVTTTAIYQILFFTQRKQLKSIAYDKERLMHLPGFWFDKKLIKAINQQCKELGWLE